MPRTDIVHDRDHWHAEARRLQAANERVGAWLSAALDDPAVCEAMKEDIRAWFDAQPK